MDNEEHLLFFNAKDARDARDAKDAKDAKAGSMVV